MAPQEPRLTTFRFSTKGLLPAQRLSSWNDLYGLKLSRRLLVPPRGPAGAFHVDMSGHLLAADGPGADLGGSVLRMSVTAGGMARRTRALLADGNDDVVLHIQLAGRRVVAQRGREATVEAGGGVLTSNADASSILLPGPARFVCVAAPRKLMTALAPGVEDALIRPLPPSLDALRLLTSYLDLIDDEAALRRSALRRAAAAHIYDLFALVVGATRDAAEAAAGRGLRAARLRAIRTDIAQNLALGDVSAEALARRQGITPRYVHKLFESEGTTLSRYKLGLKLARVHGMLTDPDRARLTISAIAYAAGFGDLSTFNREFRSRFGMTPSELRSASMLEDGAPGSSRAPK